MGHRVQPLTTGGGRHADTVCPVGVSDPLSHCPDTPGHGVSHVSQPIGDTVPGHGVRDTVSGHGVGDMPLAWAKTTTPPLPTGGSGEPAKDHEGCPK